MEGRHISIRGTVQGVGFRPFVYRLATRSGITGSVKNGTDGVTICAFAAPPILDDFIFRLSTELPAAARVSEVSVETIEGSAPESFAILESDPSGERRASIPPELATCDDCLRELFDPQDRRYRYPFINCTSCGPRYTIVRDVPYDRASTSMSSFAMCEACRREYEDPENRRFHAEPNACPVCGPKIWVEGSEADPIAFAALRLARGQIVAVKGLGGFHLACDATNDEAVLELRKRKRREAKPFAIMVRDLDAAEALAVIGNCDRALLTSSERPIVLLERRPSSALSQFIAPETPRIGIMLPYTPLHHLLLDAVDRPLVMTSGNASDEPIVRDNEEAKKKLSGIADHFLMHDRRIENRADDSIACAIGDHPILFRRARGFVPRAIRLANPVKEPVLGLGGLLKSTVCIAVGESAYLSPHIGDLENLEIYESYQEVIARMQDFLRVSPRIVAHDLHPDYLSTQYALSRTGAITVAVQHHHAHVVSAIAEHALNGPVFGVAYDGTGFGTDGTSWGGEILLADRAGYQRIATFRAIPLPGGDRAIREPWRIAVALLHDAFDGEPPLDRIHVDERDRRVVERMLHARLQTPLARGVGRYFDGVGAIALQRMRSRFEGQVAMAVEHAADRSEHGAYTYELELSARPWTIDLRPMIRELAFDHAPARIAAKLHNTIVRATADVLREAKLIHGPLPVVLTGGCFQNALLTQGLLAELDDELEVFLHREVPPGDGGLALGQAVAADAIVQGLEKASGLEKGAR